MEAQQVLVSLAGVQTATRVSEQIRLRTTSANRSDRRKSAVSATELVRYPLQKYKTGVDHPEFWRLWLQYRDYYYSRCLHWMGGNSHDAEESLSQAMFQAWNKWLDYGEKVTNPKAWLTRLIYNHCMDIYRKRRREAQKIENIDYIEFVEHSAIISSGESPESKICRWEMRKFLHKAIATLPTKLQDPFILRYCQNKTYKEIAQKLTLSEDNAYKRVQQARTILRDRLNKYVTGEDKTSLKSLTPVVEDSQPNETAILEWEEAMEVYRRALKQQLLYPARQEVEAAVKQLQALVQKDSRV